MTQHYQPLTTSREERGRAIAEKSGMIQKVKDNQYKVRSQSGNGSYEIKITGHGTECSCPDFQNRHQPCKHILGLRYYLEVQKDTPQGTVTEKVRLTYSQAWGAYNAAQTEEIKIFDALPEGLGKGNP